MNTHNEGFFIRVSVVGFCKKSGKGLGGFCKNLR